MFHLRILFLPFIVLLQNKHTTLAENLENLISVQPRISAHLELAPTLKVQKFNVGFWSNALILIGLLSPRIFLEP